MLCRLHIGKLTSLFSHSQSPTSMTVASHVRGTRQERVFLHSTSEWIFFGGFDGKCWDTICDLCCENEGTSSKTQFYWWNIYSSFTHQMKHHLDTCSHYHYHCCCSQINLYFCEQQQETSTKVTAWIIKRNTNHSHRVLLVVSPLGRSSDFFLTRRCFSPPPHPGLLWAVSLFCSTREMGWVQESDPVLRMSLQPARILSSCWRNTAMERWESTVSEAWKTVFFTWKQRILSLFIGI